MQWMNVVLLGLAVLGLAFKLASAILSSFNSCLAQIETTLDLLRRLTFRRSKRKRTPNPKQVRGRP